MKTAFESSAAIVFDDYLDIAEYRKVLALVATSDYLPLHATKWAKAWKLTDGMPFVGQHYFSCPTPGADKQFVYGSGAPIDPLFSKILSQTDVLAPWIGRYHREWSDFQLAPYLYPAGVGLSWHDDGHLFTGSCVYYVHPIWKSSWGGELLVARESAVDMESVFRPASTVPLADRAYARYRPNAEIGPNYFEEDIEEAITGSGVGTYILPRPNRIAFVKGRHVHAIKRVDPNAGENLRCSISGFFRRVSDPKVE